MLQCTNYKEAYDRLLFSYSRKPSFPADCLSAVTLLYTFRALVQRQLTHNMWLRHGDSVTAVKVITVPHTHVTVPHVTVRK